jgi:hypothetical protein
VLSNINLGLEEEGAGPEENDIPEQVVLKALFQMSKAINIWLLCGLGLGIFTSV